MQRYLIIFILIQDWVNETDFNGCITLNDVDYAIVFDNNLPSNDGVNVGIHNDFNSGGDGADERFVLDERSVISGTPEPIPFNTPGI